MIFLDFFLGFSGGNFRVFWSNLRVLGRIGRSGKVLGFISSNFGPNPTAGRPPKGNNRVTIIIIIIPDCLFSELFKEFSGVIFWGVRHYLEIIWGSFREDFEGKTIQRVKEKTPET